MGSTVLYVWKRANPKSILSQLDTAIENGDSVFNMTGGEQLRDYLPVEAVAQQLLDLFLSRKEGTYNICSEKPISVRRLVEERIRERSSAIKLNLGYYPYPEEEPMAFWGVRDMGETLYLPTLPNAPLKTEDQRQNLARCGCVLIQVLTSLKTRHLTKLYLTTALTMKIARHTL